MQVWDDLGPVPEDWPASVVAIGVFDGVHRGHRELIRTAVQKAAVLGMPAVVLTFSPNPAEVLGHGTPPARLSTLEQRLRLFESLGVSATYVMSFNKEVSALAPSQFAGSFLSDKLHTALVVVGENFRFGYKARGDVTMLASLGESLGFKVDPVYLLKSQSLDQTISSTLIRTLVADGDVATAARALVRPHRMEGVVVRGDGRGRELGFPTANLDPTPNPAYPADGVYAGRILVDPYSEDPKAYCAAISVGTNPTFEGVERRVESWAYDETGLDLYDRNIAVDFVARIRGQEKFSDVAALIKAVEADAEQARTLLGG